MPLAVGVVHLRQDRGQRPVGRVAPEHGERVEDAVPAHLLPLASPDVLDHLTGQPGPLEQVNDLEHPGTGVPHELPDGDRSPLIVLDHSRLDDLGIDKGDSTHHAVTFETGEETIFGIHAILQGQQDRVWGHHRRDLVHHVIQVVSLDRQDDQVRLWEIARIGGRRRPYREGALGAADREAMLSDRLKRPWP